MITTDKSSVIKSASVQGIRRIGGNGEREAPSHRRDYKEATQEQATVAVQGGSALKQESVLPPTPASTPAPTEVPVSAVLQENEWQDNVLSSLQQEVEALKEENAELTQARDHIQTAHDQLQESIQQDRESASSEGFERGYEDGLAKGKADLEQQTANLSDMGVLLQNAINSQWQEIDKLAVEIGFSSLIKFIGDRMGDKAFVSALILEAVQKIRGEKNLCIHISPRDFKLLSGGLDSLRQQLAKTRVEFQSDTRVEVGGCIVNADHGSWDARLETQVQRLKNVLTELEH